MSRNFDESELGWDLYGTVASTPFIARTERATLRSISNRTLRTALAHQPSPEDTDNDGDKEGKR